MQQHDEELLARVDERTKLLVDKVSAHDVECRTQFSELERQIEELHELFVTQDQFAPVRNIAYGLVGAVLLGVLAAMLALIFRDATVIMR